MDIKKNLQEVLSDLPTNVRLVAVSKFHPKEAILEAYQAGQLIFGENKVQEMDEKHEALPKDIQWHFIGHLQSNKVKYIAPYVAMIHGIDSYKLLTEVDKQAAKHDRIIPCLLQLHIAQEETKFGFSFDECTEMLDKDDWRSLKNISIHGVMGMASNTNNTQQVRSEFHSLHAYYEELKGKYFSDHLEFCEVSMGMSHDYPIAIEEGSTIVRIGSKIFGERVY